MDAAFFGGVFFAFFAVVFAVVGDFFAAGCGWDGTVAEEGLDVSAGSPTLAESRARASSCGSGDEVALVDTALRGGVLATGASILAGIGSAVAAGACVANGASREGCEERSVR